MKDQKEDQTGKALIYAASTAAFISLLFIICGSIFISTLLFNGPPATAGQVEKQIIISAVKRQIKPADTWKAPDESTIPAGKYGNMIRYGKELLPTLQDILGLRDLSPVSVMG